jgi:hypothetical protein
VVACLERAARRPGVVPGGVAPVGAAGAADPPHDELLVLDDDPRVAVDLRDPLDSTHGSGSSSTSSTWRSTPSSPRSRSIG